VELTYLESVNMPSFYSVCASENIGRFVQCPVDPSSELIREKSQRAQRYIEKDELNSTRQ